MFLNENEIADAFAWLSRVWLFLDYDGTLAEFAPSPDHIFPDPELINLLDRLTNNPRVRIAIISGRRLDHIQLLVPVQGIYLGGSYGVDLITDVGKAIVATELTTIRPFLDAIKPVWVELIQNRMGIYLEDKGWSLAIHAKEAEDLEASKVIHQARQVAEKLITSQAFTFLGGNKFFEVGSSLANKGRTVKFLLENYPFQGASPIYIGDDDKDEEAFKVIKEKSGIAIVVSPRERLTNADYYLKSPQSVRKWLGSLEAHLNEVANVESNQDH